MNSLIVKKILDFIIGSIAGSLITAFIVKSKHAEKVDALESQIDRYENHIDEVVDALRKIVVKGYSEKDIQKLFDAVIGEFGKENTEKMFKETIEGYDKNETNNNESDNGIDEDHDEDTEKLKEISNNIVNRAKQAREKTDMRSLIEKNGYRNEEESDDEEEDLDDTEYPFSDEEEDDLMIISPSEYGEYRDYEKEELFFLRDKVLVDDMGNPIDDVDDLIGYASLSKFGEYDDDHVYVRNFRLKTDFDIFRDMDHTSKNFNR